MKVGDYVRTKYGIIGKVTKEKPFMNDILVFLDNKQGNITYQSKEGLFKVNHKEDIIKSSPNIIDLIEVGDYVDGYRVNDVYSPDGKKVFRIELETPTLQGSVRCESKDIKSIVTHEQFESMEYKVGE